jgi:hypothetical protein
MNHSSFPGINSFILAADRADRSLVVQQPSAGRRPTRPTQPLHPMLQGLRPSYSDPMTEEFVQGVFSEEGLLDAYLFPKRVTGKGADAGTTSAWIPLEAASRAAAQAVRMFQIRPYERCLTHIAAMLYPCGMFYCARAAALGQIEGFNGAPGMGSAVGFQEFDLMRQQLLEAPLKKLRSRHAGLANTLAAVLGLPCDRQDINEEQVTRIASAVYLANRSVAAVWAQA